MTTPALTTPEVFSRDWAPPRASREFTGCSTVLSNPSGTTLHCVANTKIPCTEEEFKKNGKHITVTVVGIKKIGYTYAPWKNKKGPQPKTGEPPKKLFDNVKTHMVQNEKVFSSVNVYTFPREGKSDKGPRNDQMFSTLEVGQTYHFMLHDFMFESRAKGESVFSGEVACIEPFQLVELVVGPGSQEQAEKGYGIKIDAIRPLPYSLYSYLTEINLQLLVTTYDELHSKVAAQVLNETAPCYSIRAVLENTNLGYLAKISPEAYIIRIGQGDEEMYQLTCDSQPVTPGVSAIDILPKDLKKFTNAGDTPFYSQLLTEFAASGDSLYCWVFRNEYFTRQNQAASEFRGVPLIVTDRLLSFIAMDTESGEPTTTLSIPFPMPGLSVPQISFQHDPEEIPGLVDPGCLDLVLSASEVKVDRGYRMWIGSEVNPQFMPMVFRSSQKVSGTKRSSEGRIKWDEFGKN